MSDGSTVSSHELAEDPHGTFKSLRRTAPAAFMEESEGWLVTRWDDVYAVCDNDDDFAPDSAGLRAELFGGEKCLVFADGAQHKRLRKILHEALYNPKLEQQVESVVAHKANELIDGFVDRGEVDLNIAFSRPLSLRFLAWLYGLDDVDEGVLWEWLQGLWAAANLAAEHEEEMRDHAVETERKLREELVPRLRRLKESDSLGVFAQMQHITAYGQALTEAEVYANAKQLLLALGDPGEHITVVMWLLLKHSDQLEQIPPDRKGLVTAIEEANRWWPVSSGGTRRVKHTCQVGERTFAPGDRIEVAVRSANRDERRWTDPERFDASRREGGNLTFGTGAHMCLGARLVRRVSTLVADLLLTRLEGLELCPDRPMEFDGWPHFKPSALWVRWDGERTSK